MTQNFSVVGKNKPKVDGLSLATGKAKFTADFVEKNALFGKIVPSPHAHAKILSIDTSEAEALPGVHAVLTYKDVPRTPHTTAGQGYPEPSPYDTYVLDNKVRFVGDRVALIAAESKEIAEKAVKLVRVEYEVLPAILHPEDAFKDGAVVIHDESDSHGIFNTNKNIASHVEVNLGDLDKGFADADIVVEKRYETQYAQHTPIEPHVTYSYVDEHNRIIIISATQVPFHVRRIVGMIFDIPLKRIRVIKPRLGGGFGTKQEMLLEDACVALTLATGKPVLMELTRKEEFISSRTRHPMVVYLKTGMKNDGTITAIDMYCVSNTGAYGSHALTVMSNTGSKTLPLYPCDNVRFVGDAVYTNMPVCGAYRGYGATQGYFALESNLDMMAEQAGIDPLDLRKKAHIKEGETSPIFKVLGEGREGFEFYIESCSLPQCIESGAKEIGWEKRNEQQSGVKKRGVGVAIAMQGSGIAGVDMGAARLKMNEDGSFNLYIGATDLGTGSDTILAQIAAEVLGIDSSDIIVYSSDTDMTPFDVGAYASSTTYISGGAVEKCAKAMKEKILDVAAEMIGVDKSDLSVADQKVTASNGKSVSYSEICYHTFFYSADKKQLEADASHLSYTSPPPFSANFAEVEIDTETGELKVLKLVSAVDCGTAINPNLARGQTDGGLLNGLTYAICEEYIFSKEGKMLNPSLFDYKIYNAKDIPEIVSIIVPTFEPSGPFGAKSVAEISINGPIPAIANAIYNATGVRLYETPFTPQKILAALKEKKE